MTYVRKRKKDTLKYKIQNLLYQHKWLLLVFYVGCIIGLILYAIKFVIVTYEFAIHFLSLTENDTMFQILTMIDITMVANLMKMIITGSYQSFVDKVPENTEKVSSGLLKVKMGTSLIGITSIHLLKTFIEAPNFLTSIHDPHSSVVTQLIIHCVFIMSSMALSWIDTQHSKSELDEAKAKKIEEELDAEFRRVYHEKKQKKLPTEPPVKSRQIPVVPIEDRTQINEGL